MKAVVYIRVSESRQVSNTCSATQEALCRKWCEERELDVDRVFVEQGESAKTEDRTEFQKMFRYLDTVHDRISHVVVWKFDRLFRNSEDTAIYRRRLRGLGIKDVSVTERIEDDANGQFQRVILSAVDELDNANRSKRSFVSMKATSKAGRWVWTAPVGYVSASKPLPCLQIDPVRGPMIVKMFEMIATGEATKANALAHLTRLGLTTVRGKALNQQTAARVLTNGLYCGRMFAKKWNPDGERRLHATRKRGSLLQGSRCVARSCRCPNSTQDAERGFPDEGNVALYSVQCVGDGFTAYWQDWIEISERLCGEREASA
jgi:DNA invertase Pin-like site-specific DNA recombinase